MALTILSLALLELGRVQSPGLIVPLMHACDLVTLEVTAFSPSSPSSLKSCSHLGPSELVC
jgi:hypothetical protein